MKSKNSNQMYNTIKLLNDETRLTILLYLSIFNQISFKDLVLFTGKSKSTVHHHLQKLLDHDIIAIAPTPPEIHGSSKYYRLKVDLPSIDARELDQIPESEKDESIKSIFEMGIFLFSYCQRILKSLAKYGNKMISDLNDQNLEEKSEIKTTIASKITEMKNIIQETSISVFPLMKSDYIEFSKGIGQYYSKFIRERKKCKVSTDLDEIYMVMYCGLPYGKILKDTK